MRTYINPSQVVCADIEEPFTYDNSKRPTMVSHGWRVRITMIGVRVIHVDFESESQCVQFIEDNFKFVKVK